MATESIMTGQWVELFNAVAVSAGLNGTQFALPPKKGGSALTWQTRYGTAPGAISVRLQGMVDPTSGVWADLDTSTVVTGEIRKLSDVLVSLIRARIETVTGGDTITIELMAS